MGVNTKIEECPICHQTDVGWRRTDISTDHNVGFTDKTAPFVMFRTHVCRGCGFMANFMQENNRAPDCVD